MSTSSAHVAAHANRRAYRWVFAISLLVLIACGVHALVLRIGTALPGYLSRIGEVFHVALAEVSRQANQVYDEAGALIRDSVEAERMVGRPVAIPPPDQLQWDNAVFDDALEALVVKIPVMGPRGAATATAIVKADDNGLLLKRLELASDGDPADTVVLLDETQPAADNGKREGNDSTASSAEGDTAATQNRDQVLP